MKTQVEPDVSDLDFPTKEVSCQNCDRPAAWRIWNFCGHYFLKCEEHGQNWVDFFTRRYRPGACGHCQFVATHWTQHYGIERL